MLDKLKRRWGVNGVNLLLILCTFAVGGSLCGYGARKILLLTCLESGALWILVYILLITLLWPASVLLISIVFGQFSFFKKYLIKIISHFTGNMEKSISVAIFASGAGSNAEKIIQHFARQVNLTPSEKKKHTKVIISLIVCNKSGAGVLEIASRAGIPTLLIEKEHFFNGTHYLPELKSYGIDFIVLAGFLWKIPPDLIQAFPNKIVNIHPALLPKYGGKGMYGNKVHEAVIAAAEKESGITIHFVDELYDHGKVILQATCNIDESDNAESLAKKIHLLEHQHYPVVIEKVLNAK
ncbi:MAG: phosphoribosylglycinamide formyltransferase [Ferruginibacter sp.]